MTPASASSVCHAGHEIANTNAIIGAGHLAIQGNGFFVVRDPATNKCYATLAGQFGLDDQGYLVTDTGARVQGRTDGSFAAVGDIQVNSADLSGNSVPAATMLCYSFDGWGRIIVYLSDGTSFLRGQIMLQNFRDPEALIDEGNRLYSNLSAAGPLPALSAPGSNGLGTIQSAFPSFPMRINCNN